MPCYDERIHWGPTDYALQKENERLEKNLQELREEYNKFRYGPKADLVFAEPEDDEMPCRDGGYTEEQIEENFNRKKIDDLTAMLCSLCRWAADNGYDWAQNPLLDRWWDEHKKEDDKRELAEKATSARIRMLKKTPAGKLTMDDVRFLQEQGVL